MNKSLMQLTTETATDFWNDSCDTTELTEAIGHGAVGATSNPVIVAHVVEKTPEIWGPVIEKLVKENPAATEDEIAWKLIIKVCEKALELLMPEFESSRGERGRLSLQVNPKNFRNAEAMLSQAEELSKTAPNLSIKMPVVEEGLKAIEEATARGIVVTPTVCYSVSQAVAAAEAIERGLERAEKSGADISGMRPNVAIMVGRLDDHLKRVMESEKISVDPGCIEWAGVAVFKRAYKIFRERGFRSILLSAAYRNHMQWSEMIGGAVTVSIPYAWWRRFNNSHITVKERIDEPVREDIVDNLEENFVDFRRAYLPGGMKKDEFVSFGPTVHTIKQFINAYYDLLAVVRERMFSS